MNSIFARSSNVLLGLLPVVCYIIVSVNLDFHLYVHRKYRVYVENMALA